jgi:xanthine dehydrogenase YagT iron-sulfur-binding subunit
MRNTATKEKLENAAALPATRTITLIVNGTAKQSEVAPWTTLLDLLRERLNLTR